MKLLTLIGVIGSAVLIAACGPSGPSPIDQAAKKGDVEVEVRGEGSVDSVTATIIRVTGAGSVTIPVGTVFRGGPGTQSMMVARSVTVTFPEGANTQTIKLETYCINRFLDLPGTESILVIDDDQPAPAHPLRKLASCLEGKSLSKHERQIAIWVVSDNLWDLSEAALIDRLKSEFVKKIDSLGTDGLVDLVTRTLSPDDAQELRALIRSQGVGEIRAALTDVAEEMAAKDAKQYIKAAPTLRECGLDVEGKRLFEG